MGARGSIAVCVIKKRRAKNDYEQIRMFPRVLQDGQQGNFTPGDIPASIVDVGQPGNIAMAWLSSVKLASGQRVRLGSVDGADRGTVLGVSANDADGREVRIAGRARSVQ